MPKTFAVAFEPRADISDVTEEAIAATDGLVPCEFCGKNFEDGRSLYQHQTGISPHDKQPWCPLAHREVTEEEYEVEAVLGVRGRPLVGERFYLVKWKGFDGNATEEST